MAFLTKSMWCISEEFWTVNQNCSKWVLPLLNFTYIYIICILFYMQVESRCPADTPIPSDEYIRLQFMPRRKNSKVAERYTGRLQVKRMVQQRQWRKEHVDAHYGGCIFRYLRECALLFRSHCMFICVDDKHRVKVGEPSCPVAAAERGRQVIVRSGTNF